MDDRVIAGRYHLLDRIGSGSMGTVWRAHDDRLDRDVAVKLVRTGNAGAEALERFRREAIATARLNHPAVVSVFDAGTDGGSAYLVMAVAPGESLATTLRTSGPLPLREALRVGGQVAGALDAAHQAGLVHRDIKPANVMVSPDRVTVLDFGIARLAETDATLTAPDSAIGTAAYMSPEQAAGHTVDASSDVYALGCLIMTMLSGKPPFAGDSAIAVASQQVSATPPRLSERLAVPRALDDLVATMLAKNPDERPAAATVRSQLRQIDQASSADVVGPTQGQGRTAVLPATAVAPALPATSVLPAATAVHAAQPLQPAPAAMLPPVSDPPRREPQRRRSGRAAPVVIAILVILLLGVGAFAVGQYLSGQVPPVTAPTSTAPATSARPATSSAARASTSAPRTSATTAPTSTTPSRPQTTSQTPSPTATTPGVAATIAAQAVTSAINGLPDGKAKSQLQQQWQNQQPRILAGDKASDRIDDLEDRVRSSVEKGDLQVSDSLTVIGALETLRRTVG